MVHVILGLDGARDRINLKTDAYCEKTLPRDHHQSHIQSAVSVNGNRLETEKRPDIPQLDSTGYVNRNGKGLTWKTSQIRARVLVPLHLAVKRVINRVVHGPDKHFLLTAN